MSLTHLQLRDKFKRFWEEKGHKEVPPIPLVPKEDPTTLFTGSGMQQLISNLLGEPHPLGERLYNIQPCFRSQDIEEIGDNRHTTFFEMMGNWSLGDYFKEAQLSWYFDFLTKEIGLPKEKLYVTVFEGYKNIDEDKESYEVWKKLGVQDSHIFKCGPAKNWWSRSGTPEHMPPGEPGGPDSEVFYQFDVEHDKNYGVECHPNCNCGRFLEIGNSVFMQYQKQEDGSFKELPKKNVDFGGGIERMLAAADNNPDIFKTDVFFPIIQSIEEETGESYESEENKAFIRVLADHLKASVFLIAQGLKPSNKEQGYVLRRLLRRCAVKMRKLEGNASPDFDAAIESILKIYDGVQGIDYSSQKLFVPQVVSEEIEKFLDSLDRGLKEIGKIDKIDGKKAFDLYQSYGFPLELTEEIFLEKGQKIDKDEFREEFEKHKELSRKTSVGKFRGGLADQSKQTIKYHTATHLLHQALFDVLGESVKQEGSNITSDRLRFDFSAQRKPNEEEVKKIEDIINKKIEESLNVHFEMMAKDKAYEIGAKAFFKEKYADQVKIYFVGKYSKEFCGGPHVSNTREIGKIEIYKVEKIGNNLYRIYAKSV